MFKIILIFGRDFVYLGVGGKLGKNLTKIEKMNKWKIAFWSCFLILLGFITIGTYTFVDQSSTLMYMEEGYQSTETDLLDIVEIINKTDLSKKQILVVLKEHKVHEHAGELEKDTILLSRMQLVFKDDKLNQIRDLW